MTEKVDGTNIRVGWSSEGVTFAGRTFQADIPAHLLAHLTATFTPDKLATCFDLLPGQEAVLFGDGYGPKIRGNPLGLGSVNFRLFDVWVNGYWLEPDDITDVAEKLAVPEAPHLGQLTSLPDSSAALCDIVYKQYRGRRGRHYARAEGIIARTVPGLFVRGGRSGSRVMWKLKFKDFE